MSRSLALREIETFIAVAENGGIARAAEVLGFTQPAVTQQVQRLEAALGVRLFERHRKQLVLTRVGRDALAPARRLLADARRFERIANWSDGAQPQTLTIGSLEPAAGTRLSRVLSRLRADAPHLDIRVLSLGADAIADAARAGSIDVGITSPAQVEGWVHEPLFNERLVALVPAQHALASQTSVSISRLASEMLVLTDDSCVYRRTIERAFARANARVSVAVQMGSIACLPGAVLAGLGIAIVPKGVPMPPESDLRIVPIRERIEVSIGVLHPKIMPHDSPSARFITAVETLRR